MSTSTETVPRQRTEQGEPVLRAEGVTLRFGGLTSLGDVGLTLHRGEILAVIGPNGAGKTSLFNSLTGVYLPQEGVIEFLPEGTGSAVPLVRTTKLLRRRKSRKPHLVNRVGVSRTFQNIRLFNALTVLENVQIAAETRSSSGPVGVMLGLPRNRKNERAARQHSREMLEFVGLRGKESEIAASLSYGDQRRLEIARALASDPKILLLDEPAAGTNPSEKLGLAQLITRINTELGISILLIEHDMRLVMSVAHRITVLNFGKVIASGLPSEVQQNPAVIEAYLGSGAAEEAAAEAEAHAAEATAAAVAAEEALADEAPAVAEEPAAKVAEAPAAETGAETDAEEADAEPVAEAEAEAEPAVEADAEAEPVATAEEAEPAAETEAVAATDAEAEAATDEAATATEAADAATDEAEATADSATADTAAATTDAADTAAEEAGASPARDTEEEGSA